MSYAEVIKMVIGSRTRCSFLRKSTTTLGLNTLTKWKATGIMSLATDTGANNEQVKKDC